MLIFPCGSYSFFVYRYFCEPVERTTKTFTPAVEERTLRTSGGEFFLRGDPTGTGSGSYYATGTGNDLIFLLNEYRALVTITHNGAGCITSVSGPLLFVQTISCCDIDCFGFFTYETGTGTSAGNRTIVTRRDESCCENRLPFRLFMTITSFTPNPSIILNWNRAKNYWEGESTYSSGSCAAGNYIVRAALVCSGSSWGVGLCFSPTLTGDCSILTDGAAAFEPDFNGEVTEISCDPLVIVFQVDGCNTCEGLKSIVGSITE